jgi:putative membrane protein
MMIARLLAGSVAGTVATVPMTSYWEYMHRHLPGEPPRPLPPREIVEAIAVKAGVSRQISERDMQNAALFAHFCYGSAMGTVFGALTPARTGPAIGAGMLFGLAVWSGSYLGWLPATGLRHSPRYDQPARTGLMIGGHLVWGAAMGLFAGLLLRK